MSRIKKLFIKLCHVDPVEADTIRIPKNVSDADAIAALREQLSNVDDMGLSNDDIVLNPDDPMAPSNLANGEGFKPVDKAGWGGQVQSATISLNKYLCIAEDTATIKYKSDDETPYDLLSDKSFEKIRVIKDLSWKIYCPESITNNSNYNGPLYGYIFDETFSVLILDHPSYQRDDLIIGFIEADDYPYPHHSSNKCFLSGKYEESQLVLYLLYDNFYFTGTIRWKDYHLDPNATEYDISVVEMRTILDSNLSRVCYSTKVTSYQDLSKWNKIIERKVDEWHIQIPQSIISNIDFDGAIFGDYQQNSRKVFIFDTVTFPEKIDDSKMIGYIHGKNCTSIVSSAELGAALYGYFYISGEFENSVLNFSIWNSSFKFSDGTLLNNKEGFYRVVLQVRQTCASVSDEDEEELQFLGEA